MCLVPITTARSGSPSTMRAQATEARTMRSTTSGCASTSVALVASEQPGAPGFVPSAHFHRRDDGWLDRAPG
jgi:hypothetical protein